MGFVEPYRQVVRIDVEAARVDVDEHRHGAEQRHDLGRGREGEGRNEDGVAAADARGHEGHEKGIGAARAGHDMRRAGEIGEGALQRLHLRAHDELPVVENPADRRVDLRLEVSVLGLEVDEGDARRHGFSR